MINLDILSINDVNKITTDFRVETVAAEMIESGVPADRILIVPLGAIHRPYRKDIEDIENETSKYDHKDYILIKTFKEGLYDQLPEGIFHTAISYASSKTEQQIVEAIKLHRLEEKAARKFFLPFDTALNGVRVASALYENQLDKKFHFDQLVSIFSSHWEIFNHLNIFQANVFLQFLPVIHRIRDDWNTIALLFELIFLTPAKLEIRNQVKRIKTQESNTANASGLGQNRVGVDFTTGDYVVGGEFVEMVITLGPLSAAEVNTFTGVQKQEKVLLMLCDYLLPADLDIVIEYELAKTEQLFTLSRQGNADNNCEMGVSTYL